MADENVPPKDLEVRLTELENAVQSLVQSLQPAAAGTQAPSLICVVCQQCYQCFNCFHCYACRPICFPCRPICAECNGCLPM